MIFRPIVGCKTTEVPPTCSKTSADFMSVESQKRPLSGKDVSTFIPTAVASDVPLTGVLQLSYL